MEATLKQLTEQGEAREAEVVQLRASVRKLEEEKIAAVAERDQAHLDAKRAFSTVSNATKSLQESEKAREQILLEKAQVTESLEAAIKEHQRVQRDSEQAMAEQLKINERLLADLHAAHDAQTKAEAARFAAVEAESSLRSELEVLVRAKDEIEEERNGLKTEIESLKASGLRMEKALASKESDYSKLASDMEVEMSKLHDEVSSLSANLSEIESLKNATEQRLAHAEGEGVALQSKLDEALASKSSVQEELESLKQVVASVDAEKNELKAQITENTRKQEEAEEKLAIVMKQLNEHERDAESKQTEAARAHEALQAELDKAKAELIAREEELKHVKDSSLQITSLQARLDEAWDSLTKEEKKRQALENELDGMRKELSSVEEERNDLRAELSKVLAEEKLPSSDCKVDIHNMNDNSESHRMQKEIDRLKSSEEGLRKLNMELIKRLRNGASDIQASRS